MQRIRLIFTILMFIAFSLSTLAADKIALTLKARGEATLKRAEEEDFKPTLKVGTSLFNEDHIKTGENGYAVLVFLDDKSQIKIRQNSEMVVSGTRSDQAINKQISMQIGTLKAEVSPQRKGEFVIATPTSVASVKGTVFWVMSDPVFGDTFYGVSGTIEVTNNESGSVVVVGANQTGTSTPDGNVNVEETQDDDMPIEEDEEEDEEATNTIRIQLQNSQGDLKEIKIDYK